MSKQKQKNTVKNMKAHFYNSENGSVIVEDIIDVFGDQIETARGVYPVEESKKYFDEVNGYVIHVYDLDLPAKVEASRLKQLRRSNALQRIFEYDVKQKPDMMKFLPYIIIFMLILFK